MDSDKQQQEEDSTKYDRQAWKENVSFGGNIWAQIGNSNGQGYTLLLLQPMAFYKFTENTIAGLGVTYIYINQTLQYSNQKYESSNNIYGFNILGRQILFGPVFAQAEYCPLNFESMNGYGDTKRVWAQSLLVGGGVRQEMGNGAMYATFMYDLLWKEFDYLHASPDQYNTTFYNSPFRFNVGFMF